MAKQNKKQEKVEEVKEEITHVITNEDLENNSELVDNGIEASDIVSFPKEDEVTPEEMEQLFRAAVRDFVEVTQGVYLGGRAAECRKRLLTFF